MLQQAELPGTTVLQQFLVRSDAFWSRKVGSPLDPANYRFAPEQRLDLRKAADLGKDLHALRTQLRRNRIHDWIADARHELDESLERLEPTGLQHQFA